MHFSTRSAPQQNIVKKKFLSLTTPIDRMILMGSFIFLVWLYSYYWGGNTQSSHYALIMVANQTPIRVNLQEIKQLSFQGSLGESLIEVKEGNIRFITSPCQHKHCVRTGWLPQKGNFVACLPNQVSITLYDARLTQFDAVVY